MAGKPGHGGRPPLNISDHLLRGSFRRDRHGAALEKLVTPPADTEITDAQRRGLLRGLGKDGRAFVADLLTEFGDWNAAKRALLRRAGRTIDRIAALDAAIQEGGAVVVSKRGITRAHVLLAAHRSETRTLMNLINAIDLKETD